LVDDEYSSTSWQASNLLDSDNTTHWKSPQPQNDIIFSFEDSNSAQCLAGFKLNNYGLDTTSVKEFALFATTDGAMSTNTTRDDWQPIVADANPSDKIDYLNWIQGAKLVSIDKQHNSTSWAAENINDGNNSSHWLSNKKYNKFEFNFDTDWDGNTSDPINISEIELTNYVYGNRSVKELQIDVTSDGLTWQRLEVPGSVAGERDINFISIRNGGILGSIDAQHSAYWAGVNMQDADDTTLWLSSKSNNTIEFTFDPNNNGISGAEGDTDDLFLFNEISIENYGVSERSVREFQVEVKTDSNPNWSKLTSPAAEVGDPDYNFALSHHGAVLVEVDGQHNTTSYAAANIHDGDSNSRWLSGKGNNTLAFQFDVDEDGIYGGSTDLFTFDKFFFRNFSDSNYNTKSFQVAVKTAANPNWTYIKVPGTSAGIANYNFAQAQQGGVLVAIDGEHNSTNWAAKNIQDDDFNSMWLAKHNQSNTLDFQFDANFDGVVAGVDDAFTLQSFHLINYGENDRAIEHFQVEVKTISSPNWTKIPVFSSQAGEPDYPFSLSANGGSLSYIDDELNASNYAASNLIDGLSDTHWISNKINSTLSFSFDANNDGVSGDGVNIDKITLYNYEYINRAIKNFEIDIQISGGAWQTISSPSGGTTFTATNDSSEQTWSIGAYSNVTSVRIRTLSNYGDNTYIGARQLIFSGNTVGTIYTFTAAMHDNGETFTLDPANPIENVTDVRLRTITNYGDRSYIGAREFRVQGLSLTPSYVFEAASHDDGEIFEIDSDDVPVDITDVKFVTINNHGNPSYIGAKEFKILGPAITKSKTFVAQNTGNPQSFTLLSNDIPTDVSALRLTTISNYGNYYTGMKEFAVLGPSLHPSNTFTFDKTGVPQRIVLDSEDAVSNVTGVRIYTISNHGDNNYIGFSDLKLFGDPLGPSYIFTAENNTNIQSFQFDPTIAELLRFRNLNNYGHQYQSRAADMSFIPGVCKTAVWRFNEINWLGASNEVLDSSGSGNHGRALGFDAGDNPHTTDESPVIEGNPGTCRYGDFDGIDDYIVVNNGGELDDVSGLTVSAWLKPNSFLQTGNATQSGVFSQGVSIDQTPSYSAFFTNSSSEANSASSRLSVDIDGSNDRFVSNTVFNIDTWYHIAIVFDGKLPAAERVKLYVNGILDGTFSESSETIPDSSGNFLIGNLYSANNQLKVFNGAIDDVNVRPVASSASQINYLMNRVSMCSPPLHHIQIEHDGSALTCSPENVTIKACADANCDTLIASNIEVSLSASINDAVWSENPVFIPAGTSKQVTLSHTSAQTLSVTAVPSIAAQLATSCEPNCDITFHDSGYVLSLDNHASCSVASLTIQALKLSDSGTSCAPAFTGDQPVDLVFNYANPSSGSKLPLLAGTSMAAASVAQTRTLNFDATATATLDFKYEDAGQISIGASSASSTGLAPGSVNSVVYPAKIIVTSPDTNADCPAGDASCSSFTPAASTFTLSLSAACADDTITPNFQMNNIPLSVNTVAPALGNPVSLGVNSVNFVAADNGVHVESAQSVSEVGVFTITASPPINSYFGETIAATTSANIGRFTPAYYELELLQNGILSSTNGFVYSGEMAAATPAKGLLSYAIAPSFSVTAKNAADTTTKNYIDDFAKLTLNDIVRLIPVSDNSQMGADETTKLGLTATLNAASMTLDDGKLTYEFSYDDDYVYTRNANAMVAPFTSDISLQITSIIDSDNIAAVDTDTNANNGVLSLQPYGEEVRFGRWYIDNASGPEGANISVPMFIQYWNGASFVTNTLDNSTSFEALNDVFVNDISLAPASTSIMNFGLEYFSSGESFILLSSPGENKQGAVSLSLDVPSWLQYDWRTGQGEQQGLLNDAPEATVSFGIYRGDERTFHWREQF